MSAVNTVCQVIRTIVDGTKLVDSVHKLATTQPGPHESSVIRVAATVLNGVAFAANTTAVGANIYGASDNTMATIKGVELSANIFNVPVKMIHAAERHAGGDISAMQLVEEGFVAPFASVVRTGAEHEVHVNKYRLSLPPEELAKIQEPIYDNSDPEFPVIVGYRTVTEADCKMRLENAEQTLPVANVIEIAAKTKSISQVAKQAHQVYQDIYNQINGIAAPAAAGAAAAPAAAAAPVDPLEVDLVNLDFIPQALHNDVVFARYICPITTMPIRVPVADPTTGHARTLYERSAIIQWINAHHTSPTTRQPLQVYQLLGAPSAQALIDARLTFHTQRLQQAAQQALVVAPPAAMLLAAQNENPSN